MTAVIGPFAKTGLGPYVQDYAFLDNFAEVSIPYQGLTYPSVENAFQAAKCDDPAARKAFCSIAPGTAKILGRNIRLRGDWEDVKLDVMLDLLRIKFSDAGFAKKLLETGNAELVEINCWGDTFWGYDVDEGGCNYLGKLLMKVRGEIAPVHDQYADDDDVWTKRFQADLLHTLDVTRDRYLQEQKNG